MKKWDDKGLRLLRQFWYAREQWLYYRTCNAVSSRHYENAMNTTASAIVDAGYVTSGPMPTVDRNENWTKNVRRC